MVRSTLADPRLVLPSISQWPPREGRHSADRILSLLELNGSDHRRVRGAAGPAFSPRRLEALEPRVRALAEEAAGRVRDQGPRADLVSGFTATFPLRVLCELLGVRGEPPFLPMVETVLQAVRVPVDEILGALADLQAYARDLVDDRLRSPRGDLISELTPAVAGEGGLSREDLVTLTVSLLMAGYKTNVQHFAAALAELLPAPGEPPRPLPGDEEMPSAVEELLRQVPLMNAIVLLVATEDLYIGDTRVLRGDAVMPVIASAHRDASVFQDPDHLDLGRRPNPHLAFGRGPHYCIGAHLTRMQLRIGLGTLRESFPGLRLAVARERLDWDDEIPLRAPLRLPVQW
jgi:cytochrome P450